MINGNGLSTLSLFMIMVVIIIYVVFSFQKLLFNFYLFIIGCDSIKYNNF